MQLVLKDTHNESSITQLRWMKCNPAEHKSTFLLGFRGVRRAFTKWWRWFVLCRNLARETTRLSTRLATFCDRNRSGESKPIITCNYIGLWYLFRFFIVDRLLDHWTYHIFRVMLLICQFMKVFQDICRIHLIVLYII